MEGRKTSLSIGRGTLGQKGDKEERFCSWKQLGRWTTGPCGQCKWKKSKCCGSRRVAEGSSARSGRRVDIWRKAKKKRALKGAQARFRARCPWERPSGQKSVPVGRTEYSACDAGLPTRGIRSTVLGARGGNVLVDCGTTRRRGLLQGGPEKKKKKGGRERLRTKPGAGTGGVKGGDVELGLTSQSYVTRLEVISVGENLVRGGSRLPSLGGRGRYWRVRQQMLPILRNQRTELCVSKGCGSARGGGEKVEVGLGVSIEEGRASHTEGEHAKKSAAKGVGCPKEGT